MLASLIFSFPSLLGPSLSVMARCRRARFVILLPAQNRRGGPAMAVQAPAFSAQPAASYNQHMLGYTSRSDTSALGVAGAQACAAHRPSRRGWRATYRAHIARAGR